MADSLPHAHSTSGANSVGRTHAVTRPAHYTDYQGYGSAVDIRQPTVYYRKLIKL